MAGTYASAPLRKTTETAEAKTWFHNFVIFVLLRNIIAIDARKSIFNIKFTHLNFNDYTQKLL